MKNILFPYYCQFIGWILFIPSLIAGALIFCDALSLSGTTGTVVNDIVIIGIALGGLLIACSKERIEDEMTRSLRLAALLNSIYMNTILLICCTISFNGVEFLKYAVFNLMLLPVLFVFTFRAEIYRYHKMCENEEQD